jgi:hypothetical protein
LLQAAASAIAAHPSKTDFDAPSPVARGLRNRFVVMALRGSRNDHAETFAPRENLGTFSAARCSPLEELRGTKAHTPWADVAVRVERPPDPSVLRPANPVHGKLR